MHEVLQNVTELTVRSVLMLPTFHILDAPPEPRVTTGGDGQADQISPTHFNPLLCVNHTHCSHKYQHQRLSSRHRR